LKTYTTFNPCRPVCGLFLLATGVLLAQQTPHLTTVPPMVRYGVTVKVVNVPGGGVRPASQSGQKAFVDPKTGELREAEHDEAAKLNEGIRGLQSLSVSNLQPVRHPNGMTTVDLKGMFMEYARVAVAADGTLSLSCNSDREAQSKPEPKKEAANVR
jgi:hypothetical protein